MMFGYEVNHLVLFNWDVLIASFSQFNENVIWLNFLGLLISIVAVVTYKVKIPGRFYFGLPVIGSIVSVHLFHAKMFSDIFWPSGYLWMLGLFQAVLAATIVKNGLDEVSEIRRLIFGLFLCAFTSGCFFLFDGLFFSILTSLSLSSVAYVIMTFGKKNIAHVVLFLVSSVYLLCSCAVLASLLTLAK